jgi:hypothetical protein
MPTAAPDRLKRRRHCDDTDAMIPPLVLEVYRDTAAWIGGHIVKTDCQLRGCRLF